MSILKYHFRKLKSHRQPFPTPTIKLMSRDFDLTPRAVQRVETALRRIVTQLPVPESLPIIEKLQRYEPVSMQGQPPIVWDRAEGFQVFDRWGNRWIDWSSGVLVANAGHGRREIVDAIVRQAQSGLLHNYCFPSEIRATLVERLATLLPEPLKHIFLLTTGSEAIECAIKLCRTYGVEAGGRSKHVVVSYDKAFHGRTLGSQQAGGIPALKDWIVNLDRGFVQVQFPDGFRTPDTSFEFFESSLAKAGIEPSQICGVLLETFQGRGSVFAPVEYMQALRRWTESHDILLVCDEVQAAFGRTGTMWGFEHYGIVPDIAVFGKGISSSLPLSAVAGRADVMNLHAPASMTSTHTGNPVACAATLASIDLIVNEGLVENSRRLGERLFTRLHALQARHPQIGSVDGRGLVAGLSLVRHGTIEPDADAAFDIVWRSIEKGVLMFAPVGFGGATVKICPPLMITEAALDESLGAFEEAVAEVLVAHEAVAR
jgi:4-aminobutyrate aminotransferase/(S)-3-amino-2-methylpropionate transaminase